MDKEKLQHISGLIVCMASQVDVCYTSFWRPATEITETAFLGLRSSVPLLDFKCALKEEQSAESLDWL